MFEKTYLIGYARSMRLILTLLLAFFVCCLGAETVYKTVDEEGNIIFTDKPSEDAEEIKLQELQTIDNPKPGSAPKPRQPDIEEFTYKTFLVSSPANGSGIRSNDGSVSISVSIEPALRTGHKITIAMDGKEIGSGSSVSLQNVDRGTHSVTASVVDGSGKNIISTSSTFSLLRAPKPAPPPPTPKKKKP
jgi:uncharacterized protein DUF4124